MTTNLRLQRAFARNGITVSNRDGIYTVKNDHAQATILLPASLPLEEKAVRQLLDFASVRSQDDQHGVCKACATPDFHPGSIAPVGSIVATDADMVIPAAIGTDVNCSVRLMSTGMTLAELAPRKQQIVQLLTRSLLQNGSDVPIHTRSFKALFDDGPQAFFDGLTTDGLWGSVDRTRLAAEVDRCIGLADFRSASKHAPSAYTGERHAVFRDPGLGIGSGNHFVSLEVVESVLDRHAAYRAGLRVGDVVVMIHSGSRDFGFYVGNAWMDRAKAQWPLGKKHPESKLYGLAGPLASEYLEAMGTAARYAWLNRVVLGELVRTDLEASVGSSGSRLIIDVPHNVVMQEGGLNIHRKGATPAHEGDFALIPGSMGDGSYLVTGMGSADWLNSCSHGAGRAVRRQEIRARRPKEHDPSQSWECITLREERRIEEAPEAYKPIGDVIASQEQAGLVRAAVRLKPWITFKA